MVHAIANQTVRLAQCVDAIKRGDRLLPRLGDSSPGEDEEGVDIDVGVECARALKWVVRECPPFISYSALHCIPCRGR